MGGEAIHLVLLPGDGAHHSRVIWWGDQNTGKVLGWDAANSNCAQDALTGFTDLGPVTPGAKVFCSGTTQLSGTEPEGQLLTVGGFGDLLDWGLRDARMYKVQPGPGAWTPRAQPRWPRWYPSVTTLSDGRAIVCGGSKGEQIWYFGGRRNGNPPTGGTGDSLQRFGRVTDPTGAANGGYWEDPKAPDAFAGTLRPLPREGHASADLDDQLAQAFFGGRAGDGSLINDGRPVWVLKRDNGNLLAPDYTYRWDRLNIASESPVPDPRTEHTAVAISSTEILVFGGIWNPLGQGETPTNQLWRLFKDGLVWRWQPVLGGGTPPTARYGHAAVHDAAGNRVLVYGGSEQLNGTPADTRVWAYNLSIGTWTSFTPAGTAQPRRDHVMVLDPNSPSGSRSLLVYGGYVGPGGSDETLWRLDLGAASPEWIAVGVSGSTPGPRVGHAAFYDNRINGGRLFLHGGDPAALDNYVRVIDPFAGSPQWSAWQPTNFHLSQHTANGDVGSDPIVVARVPEIYSPANDTWTPAPNSGWLQDYRRYPVQFLVPGTSLPGGGGRLVTVGIERQARFLDIPPAGQTPGGWQPVGDDLPGGPGDAGFSPFTGVLYQPDRIMIAGGQSGIIFATGTTKRLSAWNLSAGWANSPDMLPRAHHNLVALPTGQVLAVGGMTLADDGATGPAEAQACPQIWNPDDDSWTDGEPECELERDQVLENGVWRNVVRNYHSTAILLPCGRVMSASGHNHNDSHTARVFCPPYLFKNDGTSADALRPQITGSPTTVTYRKVFTVCTPDPSRITRVCLIRPAATTHGVDANQRYVPLNFTVAPSGDRLFVTAPASPDSAPPGDYLLFVTGAVDGATEYRDLPSIAKWVRVQPSGPDLCDNVNPGTITTLTPDVVGSSEVWLFWSATADDGGISASGPEHSFDLRAASGPIDGEGAWSAAPYLSPDESVPGVLGTWGAGHVEGLLPCNTYYFAVRALDDNALPSGFHGAVTCQTFGPGCGGGFSAREVRGEGGGTFSSAAVEPAGAASLQTTAGSLVVETQRGEDGAWRVRLRLATDADGIDSASGIAVEQEDALGGRKTLGRVTPDGTQSLLGICSLRERGRVAIPGAYRLEQVMAQVRHGFQDYALSGAQHSRLGSLGTEAVAGDGLELLAGDVLELTYSPVPVSVKRPTTWYLVVRRQEAVPAGASSRGSRIGEEPPERFALHQSEPNPSASPTTIRFDLPGEVHVRLEVFDLLGRRVATLLEGALQRGRHSTSWDLRDADGARVRPGVYICRLTAGAFRARQKLSVVP